MPRPVIERWFIEAVLEAKSPISVGGAEQHDGSDLCLAINGRGDYYLPGSSLAGAFRHWCERHYPNCPEALDQLWGFQAEKGAPEEGAASHLIVDDATLINAEDIRLEVLDGIAINRFTGATQHGFKYQRQTLPRGTQFQLSLELDVPQEDDLGIGFVSALLDTLQTHGIALGGGARKGFGTLQLKHNTLKVTYEDWQDKARLLAHLTKAGIQDDAAKTLFIAKKQRVAEHYTPLTTLALRIDWAADGPLMVKDAGEGDLVKHYPLTSRSASGDHAMLLPGSSIKGSLRAYAEKIVRTLRAQRATAEGDFNTQIDLPLVRDLFGQSQEAVDGHVGALRTSCCYSTNAYSNEQWHTLTNTPSAKEVGPDKDFQLAFHNAVDRWLGNAADQRLFTSLEPRGVQWSPLCLKLELNWIQDRAEEPVDRTVKQQAAVIMVALLLSELEQQRIQLGFATRRGYGCINILGIHCDVEDSTQTFSPLAANYPSANAFLMACQSHCQNAWSHYWQLMTQPSPEQEPL